MLGDQAYGNDAKLRTRLHAEGIDYVLSVGAQCDVFERGTVFAVAPRLPGSRGPAPSALRTASEPQWIATLRSLALTAITSRRSRSATSTAAKLVSRFAFVRVIAAHRSPATAKRRARNG